ncbi:MAG TPA: hypothetical protein PLB26_06935, partial [Rubrivivax sp.]|nr:hypothetical protein [Rubrivivax sp.]
VGDVLLAVKKAIGDAVMPVLTKLGEWFTAAGPAAVTVIKGAIGGLTAVFWGLENAVNIVWQVLDSFVFTVAEPVRSLAEALYKLVTGDFKGAADAMTGWTDRVKQRWSAAWDSMVASSTEARDKIWNLFANPSEVPAKTPTGKRATDDIDKTDRRMALWEAQLEAQKAALTKENALNDTFYAFGLEKERDYWAKILAGLSANDKLRSEVERKYFALVVQIGEQTFQARQAETQREIDDAKGRFAEQDALMAQYVARARDHYGEDSKQYQDALRQQQQLARQHAEALQQIAAIRLQRARDDQLEEIAGAERNAQLQRDLGLITEAQLLVIKQGTIAQRGAIEEQAKLAEIEAMKGNPNMDPVALERLEAELAAIRARYRAAGDENQGRQQVEGNKRWDAFFGTSQSALEEGLQSMVEHMKITLNGLRDVARQVGAAFVQELITKPVAEYVIGQARLVALTALYGKERVASEGQTAAQIMAIQAGMALRNIAAKAAEAAANVYASISQIPIVGPFLAPAAAAAALAAVGAFAQRIFSAEGGYDIPRGMNPLVQAHSGEMVLPARHADVIRQLADSQAVNRGGGGNVQVNLKVDQVVRPGVYVVTSENLHKAIKEALRNNVRLAW